MSRRHKEIEIEPQATQPRWAEPANDNRRPKEEKRSTLAETMKFIVSKDVIRHLIDASFTKVLEESYEKWQADFRREHYSIGKTRKLRFGRLILEQIYSNGYPDAAEAYDFAEPAEEDICAIPEEEILKADVPRGRPVVTRLCNRFSDTAVWSLAKSIYQKIYKKSIQKAQGLAQYLVCFVCSLFRVDTTDVVDGRVAHFHRIIGEHVKKKVMPSLRALQRGVQWLQDKTRVFFRTLNERKEEAKHKAWEALEEIIYGHLMALAPQYAL